MAGRWHLALFHPLPDEERLVEPLKDLGAFGGNWALDLQIGASRVVLDNGTRINRTAAEAVRKAGRNPKQKLRYCELFGDERVGRRLVALMGGALMTRAWELLDYVDAPGLAPARPARKPKPVDRSNCKTLVTPAGRTDLGPDESVCLSWIAFGTNSTELPAGANDTAALGTCVTGGDIDADGLKSVAAAVDLWRGRARLKLGLYNDCSFRHVQNAAAVRAMLDRQGVVYEDRRTQSSLTGAYRKGKKLAENDGRTFRTNGGDTVAPSTLGDVAAMTALLDALDAAIEACRAAGVPLTVERAGQCSPLRSPSG